MIVVWSTFIGASTWRYFHPSSVSIIGIGSIQGGQYLRDERASLLWQEMNFIDCLIQIAIPFTALSQMVLLVGPLVCLHYRLAVKFGSKTIFMSTVTIHNLPLHIKSTYWEIAIPLHQTGTGETSRKVRLFLLATVHVIMAKDCDYPGFVINLICNPLCGPWRSHPATKRIACETTCRASKDRIIPINFLL